MRMRFGEKLRELRLCKQLGQRGLADLAGVSFTYISKIENGKLDFGEYPSEALIRKLAHILDVDEDSFLILAEKVPHAIKRRIMERPEAFAKLAMLDDGTLDELMTHLDSNSRAQHAHKRRATSF